MADETLASSPELPAETYTTVLSSDAIGEESSDDHDKKEMRELEDRASDEGANGDGMTGNTEEDLGHRMVLPLRH